MGIVKKLLAALAATTLVAAQDTTFTQEQVDSGEALKSLSKQALDAALARLPESGEGCTRENVRVRREWRNLPAEMRIKYTDAMLCLQAAESINTEIDGAKSAYDDFAVLHYNLTPFVHNSATFLTFHRYYIHTLEEQLRTKCGYDGDFPYWEWGLDCADPQKSPLFDGSETSLGSDGEPVAASPGGGGFGGFPGMGGGSGGGCVMKGPFSNYTVNLGPSTVAEPLAYNPRCIKRNLNGAICAANASIRNTTDVITSAPNIELFQAIIQGDMRYPEARGLGMASHGGGHFTIGGDPGGDFYFSPLEPAFFQHHGQIDRMYFIWQNLDWENRQGIAGTGTMMNQPPSDEVKLDDLLDLSPLAEARPIRDLVDTIGGPFCFVYE
ncbi:related to monophenol monooxygenase (tyrosinase) [Cephalotrichum gorgonifer]|uniref:Related to monophenol monooxygenase (Tyrosinase) n=1 Tax=Cephalotrichum gorgonifer TaxID=2041049 RepID=A0AAE8MXR6_9PEZI|nr:related to monophenol monooxygenase (tyrosinase) [Cephalotrichum gorgonifer]